MSEPEKSRRDLGDGNEFLSSFTITDAEGDVVFDGTNPDQSADSSEEESPEADD